MGGRQPVADEQDDVLRLARPGVVHRPRQLAAARAIADFDRDAAGFCQHDVAKQQRRMVLAVFALDERPGAAEHGGIVLAVHGHLQLRRIDPIREFDLEVEFRAGKNLGAVDRVDGLGKDWRSRRQDHEERCGEKLDHDGLRVRKFRRGHWGDLYRRRARAESAILPAVNDNSITSARRSPRHDPDVTPARFSPCRSGV